MEDLIEEATNPLIKGKASEKQNFTIRNVKNKGKRDCYNMVTS